MRVFVCVCMCVYLCVRVCMCLLLPHAHCPLAFEQQCSVPAVETGAQKPVVVHSEGVHAIGLVRQAGWERPKIFFPIF
jgi:hypothetical protein